MKPFEIPDDMQLAIEAMSDTERATLYSQLSKLRQKLDIFESKISPLETKIAGQHAVMTPSFAVHNAQNNTPTERKPALSHNTITPNSISPAK